MNKNMRILFIGLFLLAGLFVSPVAADLGLGQILADQGVQAVGAAVKAAAEAVYAGTDNPAEIKSQLLAILNEAAATGDEGAIRYAIVAVMMAGGADNLDVSKSAINSSDLASNYPQITGVTVKSTEKLLLTSGGGEGEGGSPDPFDPDADHMNDDMNDDRVVVPFGRIRDRDRAATTI